MSYRTFAQKPSNTATASRSEAVVVLDRSALTSAPLHRAPSIVDEALRSPGRSLDPPVQAQMTARLGHDFSRVRVHTDAVAVASAAAVGASAYTVGHDIVFGAGAYAPSTEAGGRLLAHELSHVVQQRTAAFLPTPFDLRVSSANDLAEHDAERVAESMSTGWGGDWSGRDPSTSSRTRISSPQSWDVLVQRKENAPSPAPAPKVSDPLQAKEAEAEALASLAAIEGNWKTLSAVSRPYAELKQWLGHGDAVVALIRSHTASALAATRGGDSELAAAYRAAVKTDKITYDYIAWHVIAYANLLSLRSWVNRLVNSFDHDDRQFRGRANAERITRQFQAAIKDMRAKSDDALSLIRMDFAKIVREGTPGEVLIAVTTPGIDPKVSKVFVDQTAAMQNFQKNIQEGADFVTQFMDEAFLEGLEQAAEAVEEYYLVRSALRGPKPKTGRGQETEKQKQPTLEPRPIPRPVDEEEKKRKSRLYRFGKEPEDEKKLGKEAAEAEATGRFPHGVSTFSRSTRPDAVSALRTAVEAHFAVKKTGTNPFHFTVVLPKPVTTDTAMTFNTIFGRIVPK
jgi:hypothetical protein